MIRILTGRALLSGVFLFAFSSVSGQLSQWNGTIPNWNNLLPSIKALFPNVNATMMKFLNTSQGRETLRQIYESVTKINWLSIAEKQFSQRMDQVDATLGKCGQDIARISQDSTKMLAYLDSAGKPRSGLLQGNLMWSGSHDACRKITESHFCATSFTLIIPSMKLYIPHITWSGCFPKSCNTNNVSAILASLESQVSNLASNAVHLKHDGAKCEEKLAYTSGAICTLVFCGILLLLCLVGTILDLIIQVYDSQGSEISSVPVNSLPTSSTNDVELATTVSPEMSIHHDTASNKSLSLCKSSSTSSMRRLQPGVTITNHWVKPKILNTLCCDFFLCFSLYRNTQKIFSTNVPSTAITSINGIRVISMSWIVLGHTFMMFLISPFAENKAKVFDDGKLLTIMPIINGFYSVDTFFFLSGLLVAYTVFRKMQKNNGKFNWVLFYVHRFWRLTPSYMFVILFSVHLNGHLSSELGWNGFHKDPLCSKYWWTNLLYINNFHPKEFVQECVGWSWYLANDMQFFVITPLLLILAFKYGWRGMAATAGSLLMISSVVIGTLYGYYDLDPVGKVKIHGVLNPEHLEKDRLYNNYIYSKPYCRIQPYLVGFVMGYFIYMKYSGPKRRTGWIIALVGWSVAAAVAMTLVYGPRDSTLPDGKEWTKTGNIVFGVFERFLWGVVLAWVIYACHYGYGGLVQQFLSAKFWIPLSRLSYSVYLVHIMVLTFMVFAVRGTIYYTIINVSYYFLAATVLSFGAGFILSVAIEYPCENLEILALKILQQKKKYIINK